MYANPANSVIKYAFLVFNAIWFVSGLVLVITGTLLKTNYKLIIGDGMEMVIKQVPNSTIMIILVVGAIIVFVSLLGNCAIAMNDSCLLYSYSVITVLLFIVQCIAIVLAFDFSDKLETKAQELIRKDIEQYNWNEIQKQNKQSAIDSLQNILKCCGANNHTTWLLNDEFKYNQTYPYSCCHDLHKSNFSIDCTIDKVNNTIGCVEAIQNRLNHKILTLAGITIIVSFIQLIMTIMVCVLAHQIREYEKV